MIEFSKRLTKEVFPFGDMVGVFATFDGVTQFILLPKGMEKDINDEKICGISPKGCVIGLEPMIHIALSGDGYQCDYTSGNTQRNSDTALSLKLVSQEYSTKEEVTTLISCFENEKRLIVKNIITYRNGTNYLTVHNELTNGGDEEITVESLPSFNVSGITPFERYNDTENIVVHKFLSNWSGEGKLYSVPADKLAFEPSWSGLGIREHRGRRYGLELGCCKRPDPRERLSAGSGDPRVRHERRTQDAGSLYGSDKTDRGFHAGKHRSGHHSAGYHASPLACGGIFCSSDRIRTGAGGVCGRI